MPDHVHAQEGLPPLSPGALYVGSETDKHGESPSKSVVALPPGVDDEVLTVVEGAPAWSPPSGGSDVLTAGFSRAPDESITIPSTGFAEGAGFTAEGPMVLQRWGHVVTWARGGFEYHAADLNNYGFYDPCFTVPASWYPSGVPDPGYPFWGFTVRIDHYAADEVTLRQTDQEILGPTDSGFTLAFDRLDASLFQSGDYLAFSGGQNLQSFIVLPSEATF